VLVEEKWVEKKWAGPRQFEDEKTKELMMLPADLAMIKDPEFKKWVDIYAKDEKKFFDDFSKAFTKLEELGVKAFEKPAAAAPAAAPAAAAPAPAAPAAKKEEAKEESKDLWDRLFGKK